MAKIIDNVKAVTTSVTSLKKELQTIYTTLNQINTMAGKTMSAVKHVTAGGGAMGLTQGSNLNLGVQNANFAIGTQNPQQQPGNGVNQGLASSAVMEQQRYQTSIAAGSGAASKAVLAGQIGGNLLSGALGIVGGAYQALPDLGMTVARAGGYYGAARMGNMGRTGLELSTMRALGRGGISGMGEDAAAAAMLAQSYFYRPGSAAYMQTMGEIGGANRYLNMSNATAAQALGGFQTGSMGGNLYQYGIHTIDPRTGKPLTTGQIAQQLYSKMFTRPGTTEEDVRGSLQYGFAGANLRGMGFSEAQQSILSDMFLRISRGQSPELANRKGTLGNENPLLAQYDIYQSQTQTMQRGEQAMIEGFQKAATDVEKLSGVIRDLSDSMFQLKGRIQGLFSSEVGQGAATAAGGAANATGGIITSILGYLGLKSLIKGGGAGAAKAGGGALRAVGSKVAPLAGGYLTGKAGKAVGNSVKASPTTTRVGATLASAGTGAAIGAMFAPETAGLSVVIGALLGGIGGFFGSGGGSAGFGASFGAKGGAAATVAPVGGVSPTTMYGAKDSSLWKGARGYHTGQDYPVPEGTSVVAAASGVVFNDNPGSDYGLSVQIDHGNGYQTLYGHLSAKLVRPGQQVNAGQMIGKSGATGNVTGPHLHFEVRKGKNNPVDPSGFLGSNNVLGTSGGGGGTAAPVGSGSSGVDYLLSNLIGVKGFNLRTFGSASLGFDTSSSGTSGGMTAPGNQQAWASQLLGRLGAPTTPSNLRAITTWMAQEGGHWSNTAMYNPLNTTMSAEGATVIKGNTAGVKAYTSWEQGMQATIDTLKLPAYKGVIAALMAGTDAGSVFSAVKSSPWGTKNLPSGGGSVGFGASLPQQVVGGSNKNVYINVTVSQASDEQAIAFAKRIKSYLETDREISLMGSM